MKKNKISDEIFLLHILESIERIEDFVKNVSQEKFIRDFKTHDATVWRIGVLGEATKNLSKNLKDRHKSIKWTKIIDMRNIIIHEYFGIDLKLTYKIVKEDVPILKKNILEILKEVKVKKLI
jgi:uncharacterized protein with HEPN domain